MARYPLLRSRSTPMSKPTAQNSANLSHSLSTITIVSIGNDVGNSLSESSAWQVSKKPLVGGQASQAFRFAYRDQQIVGPDLCLGSRNHLERFVIAL